MEPADFYAEKTYLEEDRTCLSIKNTDVIMLHYPEK